MMIKVHKNYIVEFPLSSGIDETINVHVFNIYGENICSFQGRLEDENMQLNKITNFIDKVLLSEKYKYRRLVINGVIEKIKDIQAQLNIQLAEKEKNLDELKKVNTCLYAYYGEKNDE